MMKHPALGDSAKSERNVREASKNFYTAIKAGKTAPPSFGMLLQYRVMRLNSIASKEHFPADHAYFKDKKDYYLDTRVGWFKNTLAKAAEKLIIFMMSRAS